jgi:membrane protein DedA with SNARE-associated domain
MTGIVLAGITSAITGGIASHGAYAVFLLMAFDAVLPVGSELVMLYAGVLAAGAVGGGHISVFGSQVPFGAESYALLVAAGTLGTLTGALVGYAIGAIGGGALTDRRFRWLRVTPATMERAQHWFERYGELALLLGRMTPVVRSFISIPAGVIRSPLGVYVLATLLGSLVWCLAFAGVGWSLAGAWQSFHHAFRYADYAAAAILAGVLLAAAVAHRRRHGSRHAGEASAALRVEQ